MNEAIAVDTITGESRLSATVFSKAGSWQKDEALSALASLLRERVNEIEHGNLQDLESAGIDSGKAGTMLLDEKAVLEMADRVEDLVRLADPVGEMYTLLEKSTGLTVWRMRIPIGVIGLYSSMDMSFLLTGAAMCIKSGNACIIAGGAQLPRTLNRLQALIAEALAAVNLPEGAVRVISSEINDLRPLFSSSNLFDLVIASDEQVLSDKLAKFSSAPVLSSKTGCNHLFADRQADPVLLAEIVTTSAGEGANGGLNTGTLLIHAELGETILPELLQELNQAGLQLYGCPRAKRIWSQVTSYPGDWGRPRRPGELSIRIVESFEEAITHIAENGGNRVESIVSQDFDRQQRFLREVDAGCVLINLPSTDACGPALELGPDLGASNLRLQAYGPITLRRLTTSKLVAARR